MLVDLFLRRLQHYGDVKVVFFFCCLLSDIGAQTLNQHLPSLPIFSCLCSFSSNIPCASFAVSLVKEGQSAIQTPHYLLHITSYSSQKKNFHPSCLAKNWSFPLFKYVHCCMDCSAKVSGRGNHSHTNPIYSPPMTC